MAIFHEVGSFEEFNRIIATFEGKETHVFAEFYGAHDSSGKSWCPDCVRAEPVVEKVMKTSAPSNTHFLHVSVGDRMSWKDKNCPFRTDPRLRLSCIPTLICWGTSAKLFEEDCANEKKVEDFVKL